MLHQTFRRNGQRIVDDAGFIRARIDGLGPLHKFKRVARVRLPGDDSVNLAGLENLRGLMGRHVHEFHIRLFQSVLCESVDEKRMAQTSEFDPDLFSLEFLDGIDSGAGDDFVVAVAVIVDEDDDVPRAGCIEHHRVAVGESDRVDFSDGKRINRRAVFEPLELDVDAMLLEKTFLIGDFPCGPAGPVTVSDPECRLVLRHCNQRSDCTQDSCQEKFKTTHFQPPCLMNGCLYCS